MANLKEVAETLVQAAQVFNGKESITFIFCVTPIVINEGIGKNGIEISEGIEALAILLGQPVKLRIRRYDFNDNYFYQIERQVEYKGVIFYQINEIDDEEINDKTIYDEIKTED